MNRLDARDRLRGLIACALSGLLVACATPPSLNTALGPVWRGRMALNIDSKPPQRWQASFALMGDAQHGELHILSPLGSLLAQARWTQQAAIVERDGQLETYRDSAEMTAALTGAEIPLDAMFTWVQGQDTPVAGWRLQRPSSRLLIAQRESPAPEVTLRLVLNPSP